MRKMDPNDVVDDFVSQLDDLEAYCQRVADRLVGTATEKGDISILAEQTFVSAATAFEGFLSDLFLAFLNRDPSAFLAEHRERIRQSVEGKFGAWHWGKLSYAAPRHVKVDDLISLIDPTGWNLTFKDAEALKTKATAWLIVAHRNKITGLTEHDERVIDTTKAIRDYIAHRSSGSKQRMNEALDSVDQGPPNDNLGRGEHEINNAGSFLKAVFDGSRRLELYCERLRQIAQALRL